MGLPEGKVSLSITIDGKVNLLLDNYAKMIGIPKSKFARNLIYTGLRELKIGRKLGIIATAKTIRDLLEAVFKDAEGNPALFKIKDRNPVTISVTVDTEVKEFLQEYSDYLDLPLKIFARNCIYAGLDDFKVFEKMQLVKLAKYSAAFKCFVQGYEDDSD